MRFKAFLCSVLSLLLLLSACAAAVSEPAEPSAEPEIPEATEPEPTVPKEKIFLTVSRITFTLAGESENIYMGTAPAEDVTWISEDPQIVSVEDGILTAVSAGETTIRAEYGDQSLSCRAGCLAANSADLTGVSLEVRKSAKRLPPETGYDPVPFFTRCAIVGDSISMIFGQMEAKSGALGHPLFLARGGCSINGYLNHHKELFYKGEETPLPDAIADSGVEFIFMMLGENDLGYLSVEQTLANYEALIAYIREQNPDIVIFLQTCTPETHEGADAGLRNRKIYEFNSHLPDLAQRTGCLLIDMAKYAENHIGSLDPDYVYDLGIHLNYDGCLMWAQVLSSYAEVYEYTMEVSK